MKRILLVTITLSFLGIVLPSSFATTTLHIYFQGISDAPLDNVKKRLAILQHLLPSPLTKKSIETFYKDAPFEINKALQPFGYFKAKVTPRLDYKNERWIAIFNIDPGVPLKITSLDLRISGAGASAPALVDFLKTQPLKSGENLQTERYKMVKENLFNLALNDGYLQPILEQNVIRINLKKYTANVILHFNTGPRYRFGQVRFSPTPFSETFLRRFLPFKEGDFYTAEKIDDLQSNLANSNFFQEVHIIPQKDLAKNYTVPIDVNLIPRKKRQYQLGLGFGTDTGVRGLLGWELRHLGTSGQSFKTSLKASQVQNNLEMRYIIPGHRPATEQYDLSAAAQTRDEKLGKSRTYKISSGYLTKIFNGWQESLRLSLQQERFQIEGQPWQNSLFFTPSINLSRIKVDDPIRTKRGNRINFFVQGAKKDLLSKTDFVQTQIDAKMLYPLGSMNIFLLRATLGYTAVHDLADLPMSFQYFAGGSQSIRGYGYNSLGPGRDLLLSSVEIRQKTFEDWYITGFFDAGNAANSLAMKLKRGLGIGIAWSSPVGTIQLSYAKALDAPGTPGMVQFSMGPEF